MEILIPLYPVVSVFLLNRPWLTFRAMFVYECRNMGIPLALFAFGQDGMQRATLMFVIITFLQYSLGIYLLSGRGNWSEIFRLH